MSGGQRSVLILFPPSYFLPPISCSLSLSPQTWGDAKLARAKQGGATFGGFRSYFDGAQHERRLAFGGFHS